MKKLFILSAAVFMAVASFTSCDTEYYYPDFSETNNLPYEIPAMGGSYELDFSYRHYSTKTMGETFDWAYRVLLDGKVYSITDVKDGYTSVDKLYVYTVVIPKNTTDHAKPVVVEASYHVIGSEYEDFWTDWEPVASAVQLRY